MIQEFVNLWDKNKYILEDYIKNNPKEIENISYSELFKHVLDKVVNYDELNDYEIVETLDFGRYQGDYVFFFSQDGSRCIYNMYYTSVSYGSCSGCDTLQAIQSEMTVYSKYGIEYVHSDNSVSELMTLALHLIQSIKKFEV